jgi:squalene-associated FAD-dependent desaturase
MIAGGGLAGLAAAAALGSAGFDVDLHEARPFLGGRATSFPVTPSDPDSERIDNCQHVLLRCCTNLLDFYGRCGVRDKLRFFDEYCFIEPGGRVSRLKPGLLAFARFRALSVRDRAAVAAGLRAMKRERERSDLDGFTFAAWLETHGQTERALGRFWRPVIVSALNEEPERAAAGPAFQVFLQGLLGGDRSYEMGVPAVPLSQLYSAALEQRLGERVRVHVRSPVARLDPTDRLADYYLSAVPFERVNELIPELGLDLTGFEHSPITGIHLWLDRELTPLPQAALLDRTIQWIFRKSERHYQLVVSASRSLVPLARQQIISLAWEELREFFPEARRARLERAHVIKEARATFSAVPGLEDARPGCTTRFPNLFLAGDWTRSGWPATMEGAVRSGYLAAEAVTRAAGRPRRFLVPP